MAAVAATCNRSAVSWGTSSKVRSTFRCSVTSCGRRAVASPMASRPGFRVLTHHPAWCASRRQRGRKTQLALRLLDDAAATAQRALYVCFKRTLADHIGRIAPARAGVEFSRALCGALAAHAG